jgi:hypothetical protein
MSKQWYGSLQNRLMERHTQVVPEVGMGVTELLYSDREPYEIVEITDDRHIKVRSLDYKISEGKNYYDQVYDLFSNKENHIIALFKTKKGEWREKKGRSLGCNRFVIGYADKYEDPSF